MFELDLELPIFNVYEPGYKKGFIPSSVRESVLVPIRDKHASPKGALLYGPTGSGKRDSVFHVGTELNKTVIEVKLLWEAKSVEALFNEVRKYDHPIVFFPHVDSYAAKRSNIELKKKLALEIDRTDAFVVFHTNRAPVLDPVLLQDGRISNIACVTMLSGQEHKELVSSIVNKLNWGEGITLDEICQRLEGRTAAEIDGFVRYVIYQLNREWKGKKVELDQMIALRKHMEQSIKDLGPLMDPELRREYESRI